MKSVFCRFLKYESRRIKHRFCPLCGRLAKEHADAVGAHEGILKACCEAFAKEKAAQTAGENAGYVDKSAKSDHRAVSSLRG